MKKETISILKLTNGKFATKKFVLKNKGNIEKNNFNSGKYFRYHEAQVSNIHELSKLLSRMENQKDRFIVRGEPVKGLKVNKQIRRLSNDSTDGTKATFQECPRRWVMIDIDGWKIPETIDPINRPEECVEWAQTHLPHEFQNVSCHYQFSSSMGIKENNELSLHLWYWLNRPVGDKELKAYFWKYRKGETETPIDLAPFHTIQPHYTATPIFENLSDPMPKRSGLLLGQNDEVQFPQVDFDIQKKAKTKKSSHKKTQYVKDGICKPDDGFHEKISQMDFHKGNFHETIRDAIASLAGSYGKYANWTSAKQTIRDAIRNVIPDEMAEDYIYKYTPEYYLNEEWNRCLSKYGLKVEQILHNRLIPDIPHDYHKNKVSLDIARIRIKNILNAVIV